MARLEEMEAQRKERMRKLAEMVDQKQRYANYMQGEEQERIDELADAKRADTLNWGNEAAQGAMTGLTVSGGNPWAALGGGVIGSLKGVKEAYDLRRKEGQGRLGALWDTATDFGSSVPTMGTATSLSTPAAMYMAGKKFRESPTDTMQKLMSGEETPQERYYRGVAETDGGDPFADVWKFDASKKRKGPQ